MLLRFPTPWFRVHPTDKSAIGGGKGGRAVRHQDDGRRTGFFRTNLLDAQNVRWGKSTIEDYFAEGSAEEMWSPYNGAQQGDPVKLGQALVKIAGMENAPQVFVAGSDALAAVTPAIEERLQETRAFEELSKSTDGAF